VLASFIPDAERLITIEDAAELRLGKPHVVRLEARPPNVEGRGQVTGARPGAQRAAHAPVHLVGESATEEAQGLGLGAPPGKAVLDVCPTGSHPAPLAGGPG